MLTLRVFILEGAALFITYILVGGSEAEMGWDGVRRDAGF
jgi:hypothetical protein